MYRVKNAFKIALVVLFFPFIAFLLLVVGIGAKDKKITLEGAVYATIFIVAVAGPNPFVFLAAMALSGGRAFWRRDLWLDDPKKPTPSRTKPQVQSQPAPTQLPERPVPVQSAVTTLSAAINWASAHAKANKHQLPSDSYVAILECCHTLDAIIDAERVHPSRNAQFEYELEALTTDYLPTVLKGYLAIPADMVDTPQPNGKTPNEEFAEQVRLLHSQAETLHATRHSASSAKLTSSGNFLRERFGHKQEEFDFGVE
ncbi:hypothetical protein [Flaviflexus huanghaiensis]|uniref:hypothetical protein n=1 Tax=Flaviflexus huanghaiensis TaxID=1111473 RepID=UPI0015FC87DB|nr:hypothetical protein [Flaviflexus huanghaiensis]